MDENQCVRTSVTVFVFQRQSTGEGLSGTCESATSDDSYCVVAGLRVSSVLTHLRWHPCQLGVIKRLAEDPVGDGDSWNPDSGCICIPNALSGRMWSCTQKSSRIDLFFDCCQERKYNAQEFSLVTTISKTRSLLHRVSSQIISLSVNCFSLATE